MEYRGSTWPAGEVFPAQTSETWLLTPTPGMSSLQLIRTSRPTAHGKAPKDVVVDVLDDVCVRSWYRHYKPQAQVNACEDLLDEHSKTIFDHVSRGEPWGVLRRKLCIEQAGVCGKSQVDRFEVTRAAPEAGAAARDEL